MSDANELLCPSRAILLARARYISARKNSHPLKIYSATIRIGATVRIFTKEIVRIVIIYARSDGRTNRIRIDLARAEKRVKTR